MWYDEGIDPGAEWDDNIAERIENCRLFVAMITKNYLESEHCIAEMKYARTTKKEKVLIFLEDVELTSGLKMYFSSIQAIYKYKYPNENDFFEKLYDVKGITDCMGKSTDNGVSEGAGTKRPSVTDQDATIEGKFREKYQELYRILLEHREAILRADAKSINETVSQITTIVQQLAIMSERYQYAAVEVVGVAHSIIDQSVRYGNAYNKFFNSPDRMSDEAQEYGS